MKESKQFQDVNDIKIFVITRLYILPRQHEKAKKKLVWERADKKKFFTATTFFSLFFFIHDLRHKSRNVH